MKKVQIYKHDKWNMMNVEVHGKKIIVREISDQWGEEAHSFLSRPALMNWVTQRFSPEHYAGIEEDRLAIIQTFEQI